MMRRFAPVLALLACACSGSEEAVDGGDAVPAAGETAEPAPPSVEVELPGSAWRVRGPQGAVFVTYFDPDGVFRDLRNGEPNQTGTWTEDSEGGVCLTPDVEGAATDCWTFEERSEDGTIQARKGEVAVELEPVDYVAPEED